MHSTALYGIALHGTLLYGTALHGTVLHAVHIFLHFPALKMPTLSVLANLQQAAAGTQSL